MTVIFDEAARQRLREYLATHELSTELDSDDAVCSVGAINLALTGKRSDKTPECSSPVICDWVSYTQDNMPKELRNSRDWKELLLLLADCGREPADEQARSRLIADWLWETVMPTQHSVAARCGCGAAWRKMCETHTLEDCDVVLTLLRGTDTQAEDIATAGITVRIARNTLTSTMRIANGAALCAAYVTSSNAAKWPLLDPVGLFKRLVSVNKGDSRCST